MEIRQANSSDFDAIVAIYTYARQKQAALGNPTQWAGGYPQPELIASDLAQGACYVLTEANDILGVFAFFLGEDPTYACIREGAWQNALPYGTIHRLAAGPKGKGIGTACIQFCFSLCPNLRMDTHEDNHIMQRVMEKNGFVYCGIITVADGTLRLAYQKTN